MFNGMKGGVREDEMALFFFYIMFIPLPSPFLPGDAVCIAWRFLIFGYSGGGKGGSRAKGSSRGQWNLCDIVGGKF